MERFLSVAAVAKMYGISTDKVYDDIRKGVLAAYRIAGLIRIRDEDAKSYVLKPERRDPDE